MDNFHIDLTARGEEALAAALKLAFNFNAPGRKVSHYFVEKLKRVTKYYNTPVTHHSTETKVDSQGRDTLILLWSEEKGSSKLPYEMDLDQTIAFVKGWLKRADPGSEPDHDGDNREAFRVFVEGWGHVANHSYSVCAVQAEWAMYGK